MTKRKIKRSWIYAIASVLLGGYLIAATILSSRAADDRLCTDVIISVHDTSTLKFINPFELSRELGDLPRTALKTRLRDINIDSIERALSQFDKIERVNINILSGGQLHIDVYQMQPVARIFDNIGPSYYINRTGKRIIANARYHIDVPVVYGKFNDKFPATSILSLIDFIAADSTWTDFVTMIKVESPNDIILIPAVCNHVINIGDTSNYNEKFSKLRPFYNQVMKEKGWEYYDTIYVKWRGQIVAHRRNFVAVDKTPPPDEINQEEVDLDIPTPETDSIPTDSLNTP